MSDFFDDSHVTDVGLEGSIGPSVGVFDMVQQGFRQQWHVDSSRALDEELRTRWSESLRALSDNGQRFNAPVDPQMYRGYAQFVRGGQAITMPTVEGTGFGARINTEAQQPHPEFEEMRRADEAIRQLNNPDIKTFQQILEEVSEMQRGVEMETASMSERAGVAGWFGELVGAIGGSFTTRDPLNIITAPIGAGRTVAMRIAADMGIAAGVTAVTEFSDVAPNRALAELPERDPFFNIVAAGLGAGVIRGGLEGLGAGVRTLRERSVAETIDFDLRDAQLQQMFGAADTPTARAGIEAIEDIRFVERNNPYGDGPAAQARFLAELQQVQRVMGGEPMTAVARVLPPLPFEYIQKEADFALVKDQRPLVYARMEQAQARVAELTSRVDEIEALDIPDLEDIVNRIKPEAIPELRRLRDIMLDESIPEPRRIAADMEMEALVLRDIGAENISKVSADILRERKYTVRNLRASRKAANKEYRETVRAVEAEAVRIREEQARVEAVQQNQATHIFAEAAQGRAFNMSTLQHDHVAARVEAINELTDKLDESALARFTRQSETSNKEPAPVLQPSKSIAGYKVFTGRTYDPNMTKWDASKTFDQTIYFATSEKDAMKYVNLMTGENKIADVSIEPKNPLRIDGKVDRDGPMGWKDRAIAGGHDAVIINNYWDNGASSQIMVIDDSIIKNTRWRNIQLNEEGDLVAVEPMAWQTEDGRIDIGLREPVDPDFRFATEDGDMSIADAMRDLQDDADLDEAMRTCLL